MTVTAQQFRVDFPEFANPDQYRTTDINLYLNILNPSVDPFRWGQFTNLGIELWTAHFLVLDAVDRRTATAGGIPGQLSGLVSTKTVGGVSISYINIADTEKNGGSWNLTLYGRRWFRLSQMVGAGPGVTVGGYGRYPANNRCGGIDMWQWPQ